MALAALVSTLTDRPPEAGLAFFGFCGALVPIAIGISDPALPAVRHRPDRQQRDRLWPRHGRALRGLPLGQPAARRPVQPGRRPGSRATASPSRPRRWSPPRCSRPCAAASSEPWTIASIGLATTPSGLSRASPHDCVTRSMSTGCATRSSMSSCASVEPTRRRTVASAGHGAVTGRATSAARLGSLPPSDRVGARGGVHRRDRSLASSSRSRRGCPVASGSWRPCPSSGSAMPSIGARVVDVRPRNPVGWLLIGTALSWGLTSTCYHYADLALSLSYLGRPPERPSPRGSTRGRGSRAGPPSSSSCPCSSRPATCSLAGGTGSQCFMAILVTFDTVVHAARIPPVSR